MTSHVYRLSDAHPSKPSIVTVGMFDGVHLGHQRVIRRLVSEAQARDRTPVVLTFFPHPDVVLRGITGRYYLSSPQERATLLHGLGVDLVVTHPFDDTVRHVRAADFVDQLLAHLKLDALWVGANFAMGYQREGNVAFLQAQGAEKGFSVEVVDLMLSNGNDADAISSSRIREALQGGEVARAAGWLGRPYRLGGEVVHGDHRGRAIGFPTANLDVWAERVLPANGVYACWAILGEERHRAVTNIGVRPTFDETPRVVVEAHLLDFDRDIYGQELHLDFVERLRAEQRFNGVEALVAQIRRDVQAGRELLTASAGE